jgi:hypothetical protein
MQITAEFDEMVVWGHESVADASSDPYVRSMEEWLQVANQVWLDSTPTIVHMMLILPDSLLFYLKTSHGNHVADMERNVPRSDKPTTRFEWIQSETDTYPQSI